MKGAVGAPHPNILRGPRPSLPLNLGPKDAHRALRGKPRRRRGGSV